MAPAAVEAEGDGPVRITYQVTDAQFRAGEWKLSIWLQAENTSNTAVNELTASVPIDLADPSAARQTVTFGPLPAGGVATAASVIEVSVPVPTHQDAAPSHSIPLSLRYRSAGADWREFVSTATPRSIGPNAVTAPDVRGSGFSCPAPSVRINEVGFNPSPGADQWVELFNYGSNGQSLADHVLTDLDGNNYALPAALPSVPAGAFVLVYFDGLGSGGDDYDFGDNVAVLHSEPGLTAPFDGAIDQAGLYSSATFSAQTIRGYVAWGDVPPPEDAADAVAAGIWQQDAFVTPQDGGPGLEWGVYPDGSIGFYPVLEQNSPFDWIVYRPDLASPGAANVSPAPEFRSPPSGVITDDHAITFAWSTVPGAVDYHLEVDDDSGFGSPEVAVDVAEPAYEPVPDLPDGTFFFRAKAQFGGSGESSYSEVGQITLETPTRSVRGVAPCAQAGAVCLPNAANFQPKLQHKDTGMLCLQGCTFAGDLRWDGEHVNCRCVPGPGFPPGCNPALRTGCNEHDNMYCCRASVAMINNYHGGNLSQDRISFENYKHPAPGVFPEADLRHGQGMFPARILRTMPPDFVPRIQGNNIFEWAMGGLGPAPGADMLSVFGALPFTQAGALNDLKDFIDADLPILIGEFNNRHAVVIIGYMDGPPQRFLRADPWTGRTQWFQFNGYPITEYHVARNKNNPRMQEASVGADADGDGVVDFDETNRFLTNPNVADSDGDGVGDKQDIISYNFRFPWFNRSIIVRDGDALRPERDPDSDNGGLTDGQEDRNADGFYQPVNPLNETDPYFPRDDAGNRLDLVFLIDVTGSMLDDIQAVRAQALNIANFVNARFGGWRMAVAAYRDFPFFPFGQPGDFPFRVVQPFTANIGQVVGAINTLPGMVCCGGDIPESVYTAYMQCINGAPLGGWRGQPVKKIIVLMGDAPPHDPEPFTGLTRAAVVRAARLADPINAYDLVIGTDPTAQFFFGTIAQETGGEYFEAATSEDVVDEIFEAVTIADQVPIAEAGGPYIGITGVPITFDASGSTDADGCGFTLYSWDYDGDGIFDETTTSPTIDHTYADPTCAIGLLLVTDEDGQTGFDIAFVAVSQDETDCDSNGVPDACQDDCNTNGVADTCDIAEGTSEDCTGNAIPDECEPDCNGNGTSDVCDIDSGASEDCNENTLPDECDFTLAFSGDCNLNARPDECDIGSGGSLDCNSNGIPDDCEASVGKGYSISPAFPIPDDNPTGASSSISVPDTGIIADLDVTLQINHTWQGDLMVSLTHNGTTAVLINRAGSLFGNCGTSDVGYSANHFGSPGTPLLLNDAAGPPVNCYAGPGNAGINNYAGPARPGQLLAAFNGMEKSGLWTLTVSDHEADDTGVLNFWSLQMRNAGGVDCNINGVPDDCELAGNDCQSNGIPDECDIAGGSSADCQANGTPDECDGGCSGGTPASVVSRKSCDLTVNLTPGAPTSEPRQGGITQLVIDYAGGAPPSTVVALAEDFGCPGPPSYTPYAGGSAINCTAGPTALTCTFSPGLENARAYRFTVPSGAGTTDIELRGLLGDVNSDGRANATDRSLVVAVWTGAGFSCETDVNGDGGTNATDRSIVVGAWTGAQNCAP